MVNFDFLEKVLGLVSPTYFVYDFSRKGLSVVRNYEIDLDLGLSI